ncbi:MAG TPA: arylsulfotransferase family protein [Pilimelia sp.]|nr:arylsulfotransferase family protein [Pilimelia sp.]
MSETTPGPRLTRRHAILGGGAVLGGAAVAAGGYALGRAAAAAEASDDPAGKTHRFVSRPDLPAPVVATERRGATAPGYLFLTVGGRGPLVVDDAGHPVWFRPARGPDAVAVNAQVHRYRGEPVLAWWEGAVDRSTGVGAGEFVIVDARYREVARVRTPDGGVPADHHDLVLTDAGTAMFWVYEPVPADLSAVGGPPDGTLYDNVIHEVDVASGRRVWQWNARDHVRLDESYAAAPTGDRRHLPYDFFHANSLAVEPDGSVLASARHTWAVYRIDRRSGAVRWRLGGRRSDFRSGPGAEFSWQHDARRRSDGTLGLFDNAAGITRQADRSRGLVLALDETSRTATLVRELHYPRPLSAPTQGGLQELPGGASLVGWGEQPYLSEHGPDGGVRLTARMPAEFGSYRAYRHRWAGSPEEPPAIALRAGGQQAVRVHLSWNGATALARWRVRAGMQPQALGVAAEAERQGFETTVTVARPLAYVAADALDAAGRVLGSTRLLPVAPPARRTSRAGEP